MLEFANLLNFTAMSFGNHDFDDGIEGLAPFVQGGEFQLSFEIANCWAFDINHGILKGEVSLYH
jgi:2',3'-cyclic-nucleotide 2'-phosphodiesterase (5'-nucleotidase family)